jgi:hypothetical protein
LNWSSAHFARRLRRAKCAEAPVFPADLNLGIRDDLSPVKYAPIPVCPGFPTNPPCFCSFLSEDGQKAAKAQT